MAAKINKPEKHKKAIRKEMRIAARITQELYDALQQRAYDENKSASIVTVEALMRYLDFKMPPR